MLRRPFVALATFSVLILSALCSVVIDETASATTATPISTDPYSNSTSQHHTEVEPDTFAFGATVVSAFQAGRFTDGGSSNIGWATSHDGGVTWTNGFLPSLTVFSTPPGSAARASDPSVAYDDVHGMWMIASLTLDSAANPIAIVVSRSPDGIAWTAPVTVSSGTAYDKDWIVCDNGLASPFRGRCYVAWDDAGIGDRLLTSSSPDGGQTWNAPVASAGLASGLGTQPLVQPNGTLIIPALSANGASMISIRSTDGGASFGGTIILASVSDHAPTAMRAEPLPSAQIDASGRIYVAWHDCRFRTGCPANDIVYSSSADGIAWSAVTRVPIDATSSGIDHFIPGFGVDSTTSGASTHLAVVYYYFTNAACTVATCQLNTGFVASNDAGATWSAPKQLNTAAMLVSWLPDTTLGRMVGDYIATVFTNGVAVSVFALASAPSGPTFNEAMYADREGTAPPPPPDSDGDGCPDARELGSDHRTGGQRDPSNPWDFFDVPTPALLPSNTTGTRSKAITIGDAIAILAYIGTSASQPNSVNANGATYGSDLDNNGVQDGREYDRSMGAAAWAPGAPSGAVSISDAILELNGVGDNCN